MLSTLQLVAEDRNNERNIFSEEKPSKTSFEQMPVLPVGLVDKSVFCNSKQGCHRSVSVLFLFLPLATFFFFFPTPPARSATALTWFLTLQYGEKVRKRSDPPVAYVFQPPPPPPSGRLLVARLCVPLVV